MVGEEKTFKGSGGSATVHDDGTMTAESEAAALYVAEDGTIRVRLKKDTLQVTLADVADLHCASERR
jgi:hypothetical protein